MGYNNYRRKKLDKIRQARSLAGKRGNEVKAAKRMEQAEREWELVRVIEVKGADGEVITRWRVFATGEAGWPLSVDFDGKVHRFMAAKRLSGLISRKLFEVVR